VVGWKPVVADWRDASAYLPLLQVERAGHAWEWLRRDSRYRMAAAGAGTGFALEQEQAAAGRWRLHAFEDPGLAAPAARPVWRAEDHRLVLTADAAVPVRSGDTVAIEDLPCLARNLSSPQGQHLLLSDGRASIRLDVIGSQGASTPLRLKWRIEGVGAAEAPLLVLRRLLALMRAGRFSRALHRPETRARRLVLLLRTHDALAAGASQRDIAAALLGHPAREPRWRVDVPSLRLQAQRLVRGARGMADTGWLQLLQ
jgi:hypothetical protein